MGEVSCSIQGVKLTPLKQICDERGSVLHVLREDAPEYIRFGECYCSETFPHAVKAWKKHHEQTQTMSVPVGRLKIVLVDDREGSTTKGTISTLELGRPDAYFRIQIPPGIWYGFSCISDTPALIVNCADMIHNPAESEIKPVEEFPIKCNW